MEGAGRAFGLLKSLTSLDIARSLAPVEAHGTGSTIARGEASLSIAPSVSFSHGLPDPLAAPNGGLSRPVSIANLSTLTPPSRITRETLLHAATQVAGAQPRVGSEALSPRMELPTAAALSAQLQEIVKRSGAAASVASPTAPVDETPADERRSQAPLKAVPRGGKLSASEPDVTPERSSNGGVEDYQTGRDPRPIPARRAVLEYQSLALSRMVSESREAVTEAAQRPNVQQAPLRASELARRLENSNVERVTGENRPTGSVHDQVPARSINPNAPVTSQTTAPAMLATGSLIETVTQPQRTSLSLAIALLQNSEAVQRSEGQVGFSFETRAFAAGVILNAAMLPGWPYPQGYHRVDSVAARAEAMRGLEALERSVQTLPDAAQLAILARIAQALGVAESLGRRLLKLLKRVFSRSKPKPRGLALAALLAAAQIEAALALPFAFSPEPGEDDGAPRHRLRL